MVDGFSPCPMRHAVIMALHRIREDFVKKQRPGSTVNHASLQILEQLMVLKGMKKSGIVRRSPVVLGQLEELKSLHLNWLSEKL